MTSQITEPGTAHLLTVRQFLLCALMGATLWFLAAVLLRVLGPNGIFEGSARIWLYAAIIPGTAPFILLIRLVAGLARSQTALGTAFATASALVLDGAAVAWVPGLYGSTETLVLGASATILWGGGVGLFLGFLFSR